MRVKVIHSNYMHETCKTLVASVDTGNITDHLEACEYAYDRTQNIFDSWSKPIYPETATLKCIRKINKDGGSMVKVEAPLHEKDGKTYGLRSSMIGDRFQIIDPENYNSDLFYVCAMVGFDPCDPVNYRVKVNRPDGELKQYIIEA